MSDWLKPLLLLALLASPAYAQEETQDDPEEPEFQDPALLPVPAEPSAAERQAAAAAQMQGKATERGTKALLRGLDKITGKSVDIELASGESYSYGRLDVLMAECRYPTDDPSSDSYAELTITDRSTNKLSFSGWMIASAPALSALDDARYDVWVISCSKT